MLEQRSPIETIDLSRLTEENARNMEFPELPEWTFGDIYDILAQHEDPTVAGISVVDFVKKSLAGKHDIGYKKIEG